MWREPHRGTVLKPTQMHKLQRATHCFQQGLPQVGLGENRYGALDTEEGMESEIETGIG